VIAIGQAKGPPGALQTKNIENNPMHSKKWALETLNVPRKNILTRRANHRHYCIIPPFVNAHGRARHPPNRCYGDIALIERSRWLSA
jgi:hypothetical protein